MRIAIGWLDTNSANIAVSTNKTNIFIIFKLFALCTLLALLKAKPIPLGHHALCSFSYALFL
jgi:hypothetical protein